MISLLGVAVAVWGSNRDGVKSFWIRPFGGFCSLLLETRQIVSLPFGMIVRWRLLFAFGGNFLEQRKNNMVMVVTGWWGLQHRGLHDELFTFSPRLCKVPSRSISAANILSQPEESARHPAMLP
jgi:hypothetical protein